MTLILQRDSHTRTPEALFVGSKEVNFPLSDEDKNTIKQLREGMKKLQGMAVGIAAPQIGINKKIFVVTSALFPDDIFINPQIVSTEGGEIKDTEACLSINAGRSPLKIYRDNIVVVRYFTEEGEEKEIKASEFESRILQHEIDHLNGVLFSDHYADSKRPRNKYAS